jgi:hypothetical protein
MSVKHEEFLFINLRTLLRNVLNQDNPTLGNHAQYKNRRREV